MLPNSVRRGPLYTPPKSGKINQTPEMRIGKTKNDGKRWKPPPEGRLEAGRYRILTLSEYWRLNGVSQSGNN